VACQARISGLPRPHGASQPGQLSDLDAVRPVVAGGPARPGRPPCRPRRPRPAAALCPARPRPPRQQDLRRPGRPVAASVPPGELLGRGQQQLADAVQRVTLCDPDAPAWPAGSARGPGRPPRWPAGWRGNGPPPWRDPAGRPARWHSRAKGPARPWRPGPASRRTCAATPPSRRAGAEHREEVTDTVAMGSSLSPGPGR